MEWWSSSVSEFGQLENLQSHRTVASPWQQDALKRDADGRLTRYIQHDSPGKDKESNWLPAPGGPFLMFMRL
jgi:hypothetical protein